MEEKTLKSTRIYEGKVINLRVDTVELPEKKYSKREIVEHSGAAAVVPLTMDGHVILIKQFRKPMEEVIFEIPAGRLETKETPRNCALRELAEETGYSAGSLEELTAFYPSPGFSNEVIHLFLARDLTEGNANPDEDEYLEVMKIPFEEALKMVDQGIIRDSKTIIGLLMAAKSKG